MDTKTIYRQTERKCSLEPVSLYRVIMEQGLQQTEMTQATYTTLLMITVQ